jgi:hypothetical protein
MFIGHWAPALVAATHPRAPKLGTLFIAGQLVDWAFFGFVLAGVERMRLVPGTSVMNPMDLYHMPYTHSLLGSIVWAAGFAALLWLWRRDAVTAMIGGAVVLSHWFLDLIVHVPDLTLWGSAPKLGLGLWNHPAIAMPLELGLTFGALIFYIIRTRAAKASGRIALGILALALMTVQTINWFGPPPEEPNLASGIVVFATFGLMAALAAWVASTRMVRTGLVTRI